MSPFPEQSWSIVLNVAAILHLRMMNVINISIFSSFAQASHNCSQWLWWKENMSFKKIACWTWVTYIFLPSYIFITCDFFFFIFVYMHPYLNYGSTQCVRDSVHVLWIIQSSVDNMNIHVQLFGSHGSVKK